MPKNGRGYLLGVDVGGTFTDLVIVDQQGRVWLTKVPSTPADLADGVLRGLEALGEELDLKPQSLLGRLERLVHGTTVAANTLLQRNGARIGFVTTKGFRDSLVMRRMFRENMYDTRALEPSPLVTRDNIF